MPPPGIDWFLWLMLAGRGAGKTDACASYFDRWMRTYPRERGAIIAPTLGDAFEACVYGPSGLLAHNPSILVRQRAGGTVLIWPNESIARLFGCHTKRDVERLRAGGNRGLIWAEEIAAWHELQEAWENMEFGLRYGVRPHIIGSTTPKTRPFLKKLMDSPETVMTRATMWDNPLLPARIRARLLEKYEGTRIGRQELHGEYLEDVEGALWTLDTLIQTRVQPLDAPDMARVVVAVDPSGGDSEGNDEQGIIVVGRGVDGEGYVLGDYSCKLSPDGWGRRAVQAYIEHKADRIVAETNFGGDLVLANVKVVANAMGVEVATKKISASRGKAARAEPVAALYEQGRAHHVGEYEELEYQMRNWTDDSGWSPDRMDAMVWGFTEVMLSDSGPVQMRTFRTRARIPTMEDRFAAGGI
jgi:predicted phage terminase large subunit-like protein